MRNLSMQLLVLFLWGCAHSSSLSQPVFDGEDAYSYAERIQSFGPRIPGTESHRITSRWIAEELMACGWQVQEQVFNYRGVELKNLLASQQQNMTHETILLGTHYDTRPQADRDDEHPFAPVPGANDGASGSAVLLELACSLSRAETRAPVTLAFFDGEDSGGIDGWDWIVGSSHFASHLDVLPQAVIVVDMVGDADLQIYYEKNSKQELMEEIWQMAKQLGYDSFIPQEKYAILDDHTPFLRLGIPSVDIIDFDYPYWHTTDDTLDKMSAESLEQVGRTLQAWLEE